METYVYVGASQKAEMGFIATFALKMWKNISRFFGIFLWMYISPSGQRTLNIQEVMSTASASNSTLCFRLQFAWQMKHHPRVLITSLPHLKLRSDSVSCGNYPLNDGTEHNWGKERYLSEACAFFSGAISTLFVAQGMALSELKIQRESPLGTVSVD